MKRNLMLMTKFQTLKRWHSADIGTISNRNERFIKTFVSQNSNLFSSVHDTILYFQKRLTQSRRLRTC